MQAIVMVHRMQRMTMFASNIPKNPSAAGGPSAGAGEAVGSTDKLGVTTNREQPASVPPNSPFPSSPKNANKTSTDFSSSGVHSKQTASTTAPTTASS